MSQIDSLLNNNAAAARRFKEGGLPLSPRRKLVILACMDSRIDVHTALGLNIGDAHVVRNAGGVATDDAIRSIMISQRRMGTDEVVLIHHTDCGMLNFTEDDERKKIEAETGMRLPFALEAFSDLDDDVRRSIARIKTSPFILKKEKIRGFVYDVKTGLLREVR